MYFSSLVLIEVVFNILLSIFIEFLNSILKFFDVGFLFGYFYKFPVFCQLLIPCLNLSWLFWPVSNITCIYLQLYLSTSSFSLQSVLSTHFLFVFD